MKKERKKSGGSLKGSRYIVRDENREKYAKRRVSPPLIVRELRRGRYILIAVTDHGRLGVDERYQRIKITPLINTLYHVLREGGTIPDPISVAQRIDGSWWILDGQQRYWAYVDAKLPIPAIVFEVPDFETERSLFLVLNDRRRVKADHIVQAWPGPGASYLRELNVKANSPLRDGIDFGRHGTRPYGAAILSKACVALLYRAPTGWTGQINAILMRFDAAVAQGGSVVRMDAFMRLLAFLVPPEVRSQKFRFLPIIALAKVAAERWVGPRIELPSIRSLASLRRIKWESVAPSPAIKFLPLLITEVDKRWREKT